MAAATFYVRKTGSDANGGSSSGTTAQRTGSDGVANGTTTFTAASGAFVAGDVDKLINIVGKGRYRITAVGSGTSITLSGSPAAGSSLTWNIGGAVLTIGALLQAAAGTIANGDTIWIGAGTYRETISCTNTNTAEVQVNGDTDGAKTGDLGMVQLTAYTTNDKTAPSATTLLNLNGKDFLTFQNIMFVGGSQTMVTATTTTSTNILFTDCAFLLGSDPIQATISVTSAFATALNWTIDRCVFMSGTISAAGVIIVTCTTGVGADYDVNLVVKNSLFITGGNTPVFRVTNSGTAANKGNGVKATNCTFIGSGVCTTVATQVSTTLPSTFNNCVMYCGNINVLSAGTAGQITEDYNLIWGASPRANVTAGAHSVSDFSYAPLFHFGQERIWGAFLRAFAEPMLSSPLLAFGNDGTQTAYDLRNNPRPAGGVSASAGLGAMERSNTFAKETGTVHTGSNAISITGPGYQDFLVPVTAASTTISVYDRFDATYAGTKPQIVLLANGEIGVATQTVTETGSSGAWAQLSLASFTPTAAGIVTVRLVSNDTNGGGKCYFDTFAVV